MALATVWIVYFHSSFTPPNEFLNFIKSCSAGGVDIFVFASGLGCYYSLKANPDTLAFIKKRFIKILPAYYICVTPWVIFDGIRLGTNIQGVVATYLGIDYLFGIGLQTLWYINGLVVYYILVLFFVPLCLRSSFKGKALGFAMSIILTIPFLGEPARLMLFARVPILFLGVCIADYGSKHAFLTKRGAVTAIGGLFIGIIFLLLFFCKFRTFWLTYGFSYWPFLLIVPGLCLLVSWLSMLIDQVAPIVIHFLRYIGNCTLEIYLVHAFIFHASRRAMDAGLFYGTDKRWLLIIALSFLLSFAVSALCSKISNFFIKKQKYKEFNHV